ncbi:conserved Plasmodium protein, unknown function [Plasmodium vinckei vinckei]|uniref:Uncharacterized protein n=1 Tax=Plasmodium vinckei vinckei TaxID=54757 RepID=A0A081IB51_PLAVN|nr:conserved Plasmodium protein, unknown function [Plasmodium vinckei vinckei]KEG00909.1 hypothetical protein YYE_04355 [Plasmodium vinckei vinckei]VEV55675.1 conserved Plasmodium protein, unknown function [Plasmodium vinckei vinckei]
MKDKVLEGGEKKKKKGFCGRCCSRVFTSLKGPSITHSILFGICGGMFYYGTYYLYRFLKISYFDTMHVSNESRRRFMEKQMLFYNDTGYNLSMKYIGNLCKYYDPVALRMPFQPLDDAYRL